MSTRWFSLLSMLFLIISTISSLQATEENKIKVVVFDFGSVIAKTDKQEVARFIAQSLHISESEALKAIEELKEHTVQGKAEQNFWIAYANAKGIILPNQWIEKLDEARLRALKEIPGMVKLVKDLQKQGYQTALLSNVRESQAAIKRKLGYYGLFDPILLSYQIGVRKPNPKAYEILLSTLKVPPQSVLFIDNQLKNVEAAKALGMDGVLFINRDELIQELNKRGVEISPNS